MPDAANVLTQARTRDKLWRKPSLRQLSNKQSKPKDGSSSVLPKSVQPRTTTDRPKVTNDYDKNSTRDTKSTFVPSNPRRVISEQHEEDKNNNPRANPTQDEDLSTFLQTTHLGDAEDFLPALSFDDLHSSLLRHEYESHPPVYDVGTREPGTPRSAGDRTGTRVVSAKSGVNPSNTSFSQGLYERSNNSFPPKPVSELEMTTPPAPRRMSQFPSYRVGNASSGSRKSVGPGILSRVSHGSQPEGSLGLLNESSLYQSPNSFSATENDSIGSRRSALTANERAVRSKSLYPNGARPQLSNDQFSSGSVQILPASSPGKTVRRDLSTISSSVKRHSVAPSHLSGLGARTISPTDAKRLHRLSTMPEPVTAPDFASLHLPRSSPVWPSRNSHSIPSYDTPSEQSVLNAPKLSPISQHGLEGIDLASGDGNGLKSHSQRSSIFSTQKPPSTSPREDSANPFRNGKVPPVPAIPKSYESPKSELDESSLLLGKSSLMADSASTHSSKADYISANSSPNGDLNSTNTREAYLSIPTKPTEPVKLSHGRGIDIPPQSLRLPPLTLMPLSGTTTDRIAALHDRRQRAGHTPPPARNPRRTPTTPMTASKASFFSRNNGSFHRNLNHSRSTYFDPTIDFGIEPAQGSWNASERDQGHVNVESMKPNSPYLSSSLPRDSYEKSDGPSELGVARINSVSNPNSKLKPAGPRIMHMADGAESLESQRYEMSKRATTERTIPDPASAIQPKIEPTQGRLSSSGLKPSQVSDGEDSESAFRRTINLSSAHQANPKISEDRLGRNEHGLFSAGRLRTRRSVQSLSTRRESNLKTSGAQGVSQEGLPMRQNLSAGRPAISTTLDAHDLNAEEEMRRLGLARRNTETAARELDALRRRARPSRSVTVSQALKTAKLNIFEKGEIIDFNSIYFCGSPTCQKHDGDAESRLANFGYDDERGDYHIVLGDHIGYRYEVVDLLGKGSFGQVVRCIDHKSGKLVAIKIIRNKKRFHQQALVEVDILQKIREWDPDSQHSMVNFTQSFYFRGHLCISTELLDMNLYEFIKVHDFKGFSLKLIRRFTKQLLNSLVLLKKHNIIHCDLKPENILLVHPVHSEIKVIDFGSSCHENERVYTYIQSRFYRSPEVILGMAYGLGIDMWSLGCILAELFTGYPIFPGENEQEQLACIMEVFGPPDKHLIEKSSRKKLFFDSLGKPRLTISSKGRRRRPSSKTLQQVLRCDDEPFLDFLTRCLRWDPERRLKPEDAAVHEFITGAKALSIPKNFRNPASTVNINGASTSPVKRYNSVHVSTKISSESTDHMKAKSGTGITHRVRESTGGSLRLSSPEKASFKRPGLPASTLSAASGARRPTILSTSASTSSIKLPQPRATSSKVDLAAKAAAAAAAAGTKQR